MQATRTFRVFVSSTFSDLKAERDALQERVFPRLRELCRRHGARFQAIDLRWGVSEEAGLDQRTMAICLEEIERCRRVTPRPNFIVLLGDRYGWCPLPPTIPAAEYEPIDGRLSGDERQLLASWYRRDDNAVPPAYALRPREGPYADGAAWSAIERELREILLRTVRDLAFEASDRLKYEASATEQEIHRGALRVEDAAKHVCCFFRTIDGLPADPSAREFRDLDEHGAPDEEAARRLGQLKDALRGLLPANVHEYQAGWIGDGISTGHLDALCDAVHDRLASVIERELERLEGGDPLETEARAHRAFGEERARVFTGRADILDAIAAYLGAQGRHPLVIFGASGVGKSALLARTAHLATEALPDAEVVVRFIGATPGASDGRTLLESLCRAIGRRYGADEANVPTEYNQLARELSKWLDLATAERPLVLIFDALDQLSALDPAHGLYWLPAELPEHVRLVASIVPDERRPQLERRLPAGATLELEPMPAGEGGALLDHWLAEAGRALQPRQRDEVLGKFARSGLPLYLRLAFEEARRWASYAPEIALHADIPGIIRDLFTRLTDDANHGPRLVERSLAYLAAARDGLSEDELLDVLSADTDVLADFRRRSPRSPVADRLPVVVWSRLSFDLEPYLAERAAEGGPLLGFYHRQLEAVVAADYEADEAGRERHRALARYFGDQPLDFQSNGRTIANVRKLVELPYQQTIGELWDEVFVTLTDFAFLEHKVAAVGVVERTSPQNNRTQTYTGVFQLQADYELALRRWPSDGSEADSAAGRVGIGQGPIIVTATDLGRGHEIRCYACLKYHPLQREWLGSVIRCPAEGCRGRLRVNSFTVPPLAS